MNEQEKFNRELEKTIKTINDSVKQAKKTQSLLAKLWQMICGLFGGKK